jgi:hypothetical protein
MSYNEHFSTPAALLSALEERMKGGDYRHETGILLHAGEWGGHTQTVLAERTSSPDGEWAWVVYDRDNSQVLTKVAAGASLEDLTSALRSPTSDTWITFAEAHTAYFRALEGDSSLKSV